MTRFRIRLLAAVLLAVLVLPLAAPPDVPAQGPIKIGFLAPLTGPFAQIGKDMVNGTELFLDEIGRQVGGRKIELIVEDTEGQPATALNKSRKLVEQDRVSPAACSPTSATRCSRSSTAPRSRPPTRSSPPTTSPSASRPGGSCAPDGPPASRCTRSPSGW
jgi:ABC-type branched-subunit amino acid transport system substrate-binding protein